MVDFLYDFFYEVLSEEGIWVLILIGSAFAVASFILLMMKIETNPRQRKAAAKGTATETVENPVPVKKRKIKLKKNKSENEEDIEEGVSAPAMPVRPEMVMPEEMEQNTMVAGNMERASTVTAGAGGFSIPSLPKNGEQTSSHKDTPMPSVPESSGLDQQPGTELSPEAIDALVVEDEPAIDSVETVKNEEEDEEQKEEKSDGDDIFDIFSEIEDEESSVSEFAKNLDDVTIGGLLSETEDLSEELKNMFTKHRRA